jgi:hypothetical protein
MTIFDLSIERTKPREDSQLLTDAEQRRGAGLARARRDATLCGVREGGNSAERARRYPRVDLPRGPLIAWRGSSGASVGTITTVSLGGLFITTDDPPAAGTTLRLLFDAPDGEIRARADVRYVVPGQGMGVQFVNMTYEARARLYELLRRLLRYD